MIIEQLHKLFDAEGYYLAKANRLLLRINKLEPKASEMSQKEMISEVAKAREILSNRKYCTTDSIYEDTVCIVFAIVREVSQRLRGERHFNSQIIAALCLNERLIIEMKTGQGKTLSAVLSAVYRGLTGDSVHILTVNDYLAKRDYDDMSPIYQYLEIPVGYIIKDVSESIRLRNYHTPGIVLYISNSEIGFDYLKSNMKYSISEVFLTSKNMKHVIVDEADSILIDNARIPVVIGQSVNNNQSLNNYYVACKIINNLSEDDIYVDFIEKDVYIKETSLPVVESLIERYLSCSDPYAPKRLDIWFYIDRVLRAFFLFRKNYDYIVSGFHVYLVDAYTGRVAADRKYSDGLQQAIEAKEGVHTSQESIKVNYITTQNLYRKYDDLSGMTGTAHTEKDELKVVFSGLKVVRIPKEEANNVSILRPLFFKNKEYKYDAIAEEIAKRQKLNQPVLVGTSNIQESEELSIYLEKHSVKHRVLNAKKLSKEADIIADAGIPGMVTIATNVAGRGTDIKLGGSLNNYYKRIVGDKEVSQEEEKYYKSQCKALFDINRQKAIEAGGLVMIISQKQENRRIDNQFKGRTGRRHDNGIVMYYISLDDDIFKYDKNNKSVLLKFLELNCGVNSYVLENLVHRLQMNIEKSMFDARISTLNQDHVLNKIRDTFFEMRREILNDEIDFIESIKSILEHFKFLMSQNKQNFEQIFRKFVKLDIPEKIEFEIAFAFVNRLINTHFNYEFLKKHQENIKTSFLSNIDELWKKFINVKDIYRRLSSFRSKVDYILDYNKQMWELFNEIFDINYELILFNIIYKSLLQHASSSTQIQSID